MTLPPPDILIVSALFLLRPTFQAAATGGASGRWLFFTSLHSIPWLFPLIFAAALSFSQVSNLLGAVLLTIFLPGSPLSLPPASFPLCPRLLVYKDIFFGFLFDGTWLYLPSPFSDSAPTLCSNYPPLLVASSMSMCRPRLCSPTNSNCFFLFSLVPPFNIPVSLSYIFFLHSHDFPSTPLARGRSITPVGIFSAPVSRWRLLVAPLQVRMCGDSVRVSLTPPQLSFFSSLYPFFVVLSFFLRWCGAPDDSNVSPLV